jgi:dienelactone hydrolase
MTSIKLSETKPESVVIYAPAGYDRHNPKKYPIVITSIGFAAAQPYLSQYAEAVANAGAYFVDVDRPWNFRTPAGFISWEGYINDITSNLLATQMLTFDKNRIFVLSNSAQSIALMNVLTNHAGLYRGAICLVPGGGLIKSSDLNTGSKPFKILISTQDGRDRGLQDFQEEAWKSGMLVNYIVHPGTPHEFIAKQSQRERIQAMLHFIFDN